METDEDRGPEGDDEFATDVEVDGRDADGFDTDAEARDGSDSDGDDGDGDGGMALPAGCWIAAPTTDVAFGWAGRNSIDNGWFIWRWVDSDHLPSDGVLVARDLAAKSDREVLRRTYPAQVELPSIHRDSAYFFSQTPGATPGPAEIFRVSVVGGSEVQVTTNTDSDSFPAAGETFVVYRSSHPDPEGGTVYEYRYYDFTDGSEHVIAPEPVVSEIAFDGHRWVAYTGTENHGVYKFDLLDPGAGPRQVGPDDILTEGLAFDRDTGVLIITTYRASRSDDYGLEAWDMATGTMTDVLDDAWSEVLPDVDGHVVVYQDSEAAGESYWTRQRSDLRIVDRDTGAVRVVMPLDTYYGVGIWERWIALNNYGIWGDSLITCDLVEGGFMSEDLHVVPE
ncbi:MAG: hypothetical protein HY905_18430 [Deltaproteobacteria bacterium]|nr:hypothetical protein [Deltaproteobacteria bacterium]